jgi:ribonuclease T2
MIRAALAAVALVLPLPAAAQAFQCRPPVRPSMPPAPAQGQTVRMPIARYTLAASWSPEHCKSRGSSDPLQCGGKTGRFGFVLHGLWPEGAAGRWPQWCSSTPRPTLAQLSENLCMTPSPRLLEHAWAKHGSCMAKRPEAYFKIATILWRSIRWPDADRLSRQDGLTVGDLRSAFVARNPDWPREAIGVDTSRTGWLRELRLCYGLDYLPKACPRYAYGPRDSAALRIWRGL